MIRYFSLCLNFPVAYGWTYYGFQLRCGLNKPSTDSEPYPDVSINLGEKANIPFHTSTANINYDITYKWTVFPMKEAIFIFGEALNSIGYAYPFRLYLGKLTSYEKEDPAVEDGFIGIFSHAPVESNSEWSNNNLLMWVEAL